ncbi:MAG: class I SAM-dependent methyltransferase [Syntrophales bacterium]|nr:class I SAM-dependent methyltransferase [Syntrophales bacterium]
MVKNAKKFSHVSNFTGYMEIVARYFAGQPKGLCILDLPAGNGLMADALRGLGHEVECGDINCERPEYRYIDMALPLPFADDEFDAAICLEGVEHLVNPVQLIAEISRIVRSGGTIVITTPNVLNFYSRLQFLFTGTLHQYNPAAVPRFTRGENADRGHVFPLSYFQLRYLFEQNNVCVKHVLGDRFKRKILLPVYLLLLPFCLLWSWRMFMYDSDHSQPGRNRELFNHAFSTPILFSRSLILILEKT